MILKIVTSIEKLRVLNIRSRLSVSIRREPKKKLKFLNTDYINKRLCMITMTSNNG